STRNAVPRRFEISQGWLLRSAAALLGFAISFAAVPCGFAQTDAKDLMVLAQRFRPYLKFSRDNDQNEPHAPCSWQWLVQHSDLWYEYQGPTAALLLGEDTLARDPSSILKAGPPTNP